MRKLTFSCSAVMKRFQNNIDLSTVYLPLKWRSALQPFGYPLPPLSTCQKRHFQVLSKAVMEYWVICTHSYFRTICLENLNDNWQKLEDKFLWWKWHYLVLSFVFVFSVHFETDERVCKLLHDITLKRCKNQSVLSAVWTKQHRTIYNFHRELNRHSTLPLKDAVGVAANERLSLTLNRHVELARKMENVILVDRFQHSKIQNKLSND